MVDIVVAIFGTLFLGRLVYGNVLHANRVTTKAMHQASEATMRWVFIAVVATALGFALPLLFSL